MADAPNTTDPKTSEVHRVGCPSGNYYGGPAVWKRDGKFYLGTENYDGWDEHEISKRLYDAWMKEFGP